MPVRKKLKKRKKKKVYGISSFIENEKNITGIPLHTTGNSKLAAIRIGQKIEFESSNLVFNLTEQSAKSKNRIGTNDSVTVVNTVTLFGDDQELGDIARRREGKDLEFSQEFYRSNLPYMSVNTRQLYNEDGFIDHFFEQCDFGVGQHARHKIGNRKTGKAYPFKDTKEVNAADFINTPNNYDKYFAFPGSTVKSNMAIYMNFDFQKADQDFKGVFAVSTGTSYTTEPSVLRRGGAGFVVERVGKLIFPD